MDLPAATQMAMIDSAYDQKQIIDTATTAGTTYICTAPRGSATTAAAWRVKRIVDDQAGTTTVTWSEPDQKLVDGINTVANLTYS